MGGKEQSLLEAIRNGDSTSAMKILNKSISGKKQQHQQQNFNHSSDVNDVMSSQSSHHTTSKSLILK